jgi:hypothetical protein
MCRSYDVKKNGELPRRRDLKGKWVVEGGYGIQGWSPHFDGRWDPTYTPPRSVPSVSGFLRIWDIHMI